MEDYERYLSLKRTEQVFQAKELLFKIVNAGKRSAGGTVTHSSRAL
jgi:hypothetical protein